MTPLCRAPHYTQQRKRVAICRDQGNCIALHGSYPRAELYMRYKCRGHLLSIGLEGGVETVEEEAAV